MKKRGIIITVVIVAVLSFAVMAIGVISVGAFLIFNSNKETKGLIYEALEDGTYAVVDYRGRDAKINIPAKHDGVEVSTIGEEAFAESHIQSISGGKNIVVIEKSAFESCYLLESVDIKGDINFINTDAFCECTNLKNITLPESLETIGYGVFEECTSLKSIEIPNGVEDINSYTFENCTSLESVYLPDSVKNISNKAFYQCENLRQIQLPKSLTGIGDEAFYDCESLVEITIPSTVTMVGEKAFNTDITITVEGRTVGWKGNWCSSPATVIYANKNSSVSDVSVKSGTYDLIITDPYQQGQYLYVSDGEIEWVRESGALLVGVKYTYEIEGNVLHCTPQQSGYVNMDMTYDEKTETITWDLGGIVYEYCWSHSGGTDDYIYYH